MPYYAAMVTSVARRSIRLGAVSFINTLPLIDGLEGLADVEVRYAVPSSLLGALLNDRSLYDGAETLIAGVNDAKFARWLVNRYRKKGVVAQEEEAAAADTPGPAGP